MRAVLIFVLFLESSFAAAGAITLPAPTSNVDLVTAFKIFQVGFQKMMPCGYAQLQVPILAPFTLKTYTLNITNDYFRLVSDISNILICGLNKFHIVDLSFDAVSNRTKYDFFMSEVQFIGSAKLDLWANLAGLPFTMSGGDMLLDIRVNGFRLSGSFTLGPNPYSTLEAPSNLYATNLHFNYNIGDIVTNNWNHLWNVDFNNFVNDWLRSYIIMGAQQMRSSVEYMYASLMLPRINGLLENVTMTSLIDMLVTLGMEFLTAC